jgi:hypothetical protein
MDSDLTEIIDDYSMEQIPYKTSQVISDVMNATQARINRLTDPKSKGKEVQGGDELVKIDEQDENEDGSPMRRVAGGGSNQGQELSHGGESKRG